MGLFGNLFRKNSENTLELNDETITNQKMNTSIKEVIYLDTTMINSLISQMNKGLITKMISGLDEIETNSRTQTTQKTKGGWLGINKLITASLRISKAEGEQTNFTYSSNNKNLIETALNDYALEILLRDLEENEFLNSLEKKPGSYVLEEGDFYVYNLNQLATSTDLEVLNKDLPDYSEYVSLKKSLEKLKNNNTYNKNSSKIEELERAIEEKPWNNYYLTSLVSSYLNKILPNSTLVKINNSFSICSNQNLTLNVDQLLFSNVTRRKVKVLGIVTGKFTENPSDYFAKGSIDAAVIWNKSADFMVYNTLHSHGVLNINDYIVKPIAIYFEEA